jgi:RES domain-containing protein
MTRSAAGKSRLGRILRWFPRRLVVAIVIALAVAEALIAVAGVHHMRRMRQYNNTADDLRSTVHRAQARAPGDTAVLDEVFDAETVAVDANSSRRKTLMLLIPAVLIPLFTLVFVWRWHRATTRRPHGPDLATSLVNQRLSRRSRP